VLRTMHFWLDMGVDGFRLDAIPYLIEREGTSNENLPETHDIVRQIRANLDRNYPGKMLLAEANMWPEDVRQYFGEGDECHMAYHFPMMPRLYMSIAMEDRFPLVEILAQTPSIPSNCQWAIFLRNHDELTLEMVTDRERDYMYRIFAGDPRMRVNVGIRRRLATLMENSRPKIELISFLLMTLPGAPILYYGDEIGMGDNIYLGDRNGVRTPMQWSPDRNAGFSRTDPQRLYLPPIMDAVYGYEAVNVEAQLRSASSLLHWTRRMIAVRRRYRAFGRGTIAFLEPGNRKVIAFLREHEGQAMMCVANLSRFPQAVELDLARFEKHVPVEILGQEPFPPIGKAPYLVTLPGHGYFAFRLATDVKPPAWHEDRASPARLPVLVLASGWREALEDGARMADPAVLFLNTNHDRLRDDVMLPFLRKRRWFAAKAYPVRDVRFARLASWKVAERNWTIGLLDVALESGETQRYFQPLAIEWESREKDPMETLGGWAIAKLRQKDRVGILYGAFGNPEFSRALARAMGEGAEAALGPGRLRFSSTARYSANAAAIDDEVRIPKLEQSNTGIFFGNRLFLKAYRQLRPGINPELEVGRFLTDTSPYPHIAPILGAVEYLEGAGEPTTLAILQKFIENQGDLWTHTLEHLRRMVAAPASPRPHAGQSTEAAAAEAQSSRMHLLGQRVAQLHRAFCKTTGDPAFDPEPLVKSDVAAWKDLVLEEATRTFDAAAKARPGLSEAAAAQLDALLGARERVLEHVRAIDFPVAGLVKTRYHGDLHLGQVLVAQDDFVIVDFEGEPARAFDERRRKASPLRDVAGMLRSISYAADAAELRREPRADAPLESAQELLFAWERDATRAFLAGYREASAGVASIPSDPAARKAMLDLFMVEKAVYELKYELDNRPDWIAIPIRGLLELITK
jgi:maltose alpha-D-glucosyltransferase / alpha-amylase